MFRDPMHHNVESRLLVADMKYTYLVHFASPKIFCITKACLPSFVRNQQPMTK